MKTICADAEPNRDRLIASSPQPVLITQGHAGIWTQRSLGIHPEAKYLDTDSKLVGQWRAVTLDSGGGAIYMVNVCHPSVRLPS